MSIKMVCCENRIELNIESIYLSSNQSPSSESNQSTIKLRGMKTIPRMNPERVLFSLQGG